MDGTRTPLHDWVWTYGLQGGLGIPLGRRQQYLLDLGVSYTATSQARFYGRDPKDPAALTGPHLGHVQIVSYRIGFAVQ